MQPLKLAKPLALLSAAAALLVAPGGKGRLPVGGSETVCATGTCCPAENSKCAPNDNDIILSHYYLSSGACS